MFFCVLWIYKRLKFSFLNVIKLKELTFPWYFSFLRCTCIVNPNGSSNQVLLYVFWEENNIRMGIGLERCLLAENVF